MSPELRQLARELRSALPWSIVLPAGCGKTELIAALGAINTDVRPLLVLTHTNAGVDVIRKRFGKYGVTEQQAKVFTLDAWAKMFSQYFPRLARQANVPAESDYWPSIRLRAHSVFSSAHILDLLAITYSAVIVDEYQDCNQVQHNLTTAMAAALPVGVLGDPLQGIFDFGEGVIDWGNVADTFSPLDISPTPHRWKGRNDELGEWLLSIRPRLKAGGSISLEGSPVNWFQTTHDLSDERTYCFRAINNISAPRQIVLLRQQPNQGYSFARTLAGRFGVDEEIECKVAKPLMIALDDNDGAQASAACISLVRDCCSGCPSILTRALIGQYAAGNLKAYRANNSQASIYDALNTVLATPTAENVLHALKLMSDASNRIFRREAWYATTKTLREVIHNQGSALTALQGVRNRTRYDARSRGHSVSRTLLVKGQEYDQCIIVGADGMNARNLYVALSRGIDKVSVFSGSQVIAPSGF